MKKQLSDLIQPSTPDYSQLEEARWEVSSDNLYRAIHFARLRCIPRRELIQRFHKLDTLDLNEVDALLYRLRELGPTPSELRFIASAIWKAARSTETASAETQSLVEKSVLRAMRLLPPEMADPFARGYVDHSRKGRRRWAYATLRHTRISGKIASRLASVYRKTRDKDMLGVITRTPECVRQIGADYLLKRLKREDDRHWRGRVLECLLRYDRDVAIRAAAQFPWEFTYAVGRSGDRSLLSEIRNIFKAHKQEFEFASIYVWALGKIGATAEIDAFERFVRRRRRKHT